MAKQAFGYVLSHWERVLAAAEANRKDLPSLEPCRVQLGADIEYVKALQERRAALREEARQATEELKALVARGRELASRIRAGACACYGPQSRKLEEFGIRVPRTRRSFKRLNPKDEAPRNPTSTAR
jgi:hypothetical protein